MFFSVCSPTSPRSLGRSVCLICLHRRNRLTATSRRVKFTSELNNNTHVYFVFRFKVASYLADFDTRWPHEYEIFNFARFSSRIW